MSSNPWIQHVKKFASDNKIAYGCAISDPECKKSYHNKSSPAPTPAKAKKPKPKKSDVCAIPEEKDLQVIKKELLGRVSELGKKIDKAEKAEEARKYQKEALKLRELITEINKKLKK
jgi:hypothetical protein